MKVKATKNPQAKKKNQKKKMANQTGPNLKNPPGIKTQTLIAARMGGETTYQLIGTKMIFN